VENHVPIHNPETLKRSDMEVELPIACDYVDWSHLETEGLVRVFSFLSICDLSRVGQVCQYWSIYTKSNELWRGYCNRYDVDLFLEMGSEESNMSYAEKVAWWHSQFKGCVDAYPKILSLVRRFDQFQKKADLQLFSFHRAAPDVLNKVEQDLRPLVHFEADEAVLPDDLRCWYLMCHSTEPLMGTYSFYHHEVALSIVPPAFLAAAKRRQLYYIYLVPFCISPGEAKMIYFVAKDFGIYQRGNILCADGSTNFFLLATSFTAWLNDYVRNCERGCYAVVDGAVNLFPRIDVPVATTEGKPFYSYCLFFPSFVFSSSFCSLIFVSLFCILY
jgi:hypothetical protein